MHASPIIAATTTTASMLIAWSNNPISITELIVRGLTLTAVRRGVEARSFSNLMKLRAIVLTASQSSRTTHVVIRVTVCDIVTDDGLNYACGGDT